MLECFLRALSELGFYHAFAAVGLAMAGTGVSWTSLLLPGACFALAARAGARRGRAAAVAALLPMAAFFLLPGVDWPQRIVYMPAAVYVCRLVLAGRAEPSRYRTIDVLSLFWKVYAGFVLAMLLINRQDWITAGSLPMALVCCGASAMLLRTLRHAPEVRRRPALQGMNLLSLGGVLAAAWLCSQRQAVDAAAWLAGAVWQYLFAPVFLGLAAAATVLIGWVYYAVRWLMALAGGQLNELNMNMEMGNGILEPVEETLGINENTVLPLILKGLGALLVLAAVIALFVWMARRMEPETPVTAAGSDSSIPLAPARRRPMLPGTPAGKVRAQYRRFLKLCRQCGVTPAPCHTAQEIARQTAGLRPDEEAADALHALYLAARYGGRATPADAARAKELMNRIREQMKPYTA